MGGKTYEVKAGIKKIPVFVKDNTLLPLAKPVQYLEEESQFEITINIFGDNPNTFTLYEDDGMSFDYRAGNYNWVGVIS